MNPTMNSNASNNNISNNVNGNTIPSANHQVDESGPPSHPPRVINKQAQLRAAAARPIVRPTLSTSSSSSSHTSSSISAVAAEGIVGEGEESHPRAAMQHIRPSSRIHRSTSLSTSTTSPSSNNSETANVRIAPVAQGEWKPIPFTVPSVSYPGFMSTPPTPRSLHAAAVLHLPLGMSTFAWHTRSNYTTLLTDEHHNLEQGIDRDESTNVSAVDFASTLAPKVDTVLVVFGGYDGEARRNDLYEYDFHHKCWSVVLSSHHRPSSIAPGNVPVDPTDALLSSNSNSMIPRPRDRHVAVAHGTTFYIFGGFDGTSRVNDFWGFDYRNRSWRLILSRPLLPPNIPGGQQVHDAAASSSSHHPSWVLSDPPTARHSHCAAVYKNGIYIFGGYDGSYRSDFHVFDVDPQVWRVLATTGGGRTPRARYRATCIVHDDAFILFGGHDGTRHLADLHVFDFLNGLWSNVVTSAEPSPLDGMVRLGGGGGGMPTTTTPIPRDSHVSVAYRDCMYVFGGSSGSAMNDMWECVLPRRENGGTTWSPATWRVVHGKGFVSHRFCHVGVVHQDSLFVFGGYDGNRRLNDFFRFQFEVDNLGCDIPASTLKEDLRNCLRWDNLSDITFIVEGKPIHAHKILLMRCPYFCAMFNAEMKESVQSTIDIYDLRFATFAAIIEYIYTDDIPALTADNAMELYIAADLFGLSRLQAICENHLLESITIENAATLFHAADLYLAMNLRNKTLKYILSHFESVTKTAAFEDMARANVELVFEILRSPR